MSDRGATHGQTIARYRRTGRSSPPLVALAVVGLAAVLFVVGGLRLVDPHSESSSQPASPLGGLSRPPVGSDALSGRITSLQARLRTVPRDELSWASLGLAYVEQARVSADPTFYPKAEAALTRSLSINGADNFAACAGMAALAAARHDFSAARAWAKRGLEINPSNPTLYGALADAETQLGHYSEAFAAIQRMVDLVPDTASLARVSYAWELRGNLDEARVNMQRALDDAPTGPDRAFARYYLGELAFNAGDPSSALAQYQAGLRADPSYVRLLEGKAKAEAALGQTDAALADYAAVVERLPEPSHLIQYGELLQSLGRTDSANEQYRLFGSEAALFESNGVMLDVEPSLFHADHGDPREALRYAESGIRNRQFLDMDDAYAWALHVNGRDSEALAWSNKALALGSRSALFHFHAGMIRQSLGDVEGARLELEESLRINPHFSPLWAPVAAEAVAKLGGQP